MSNLQQAADAILERAVSADQHVPGVVAMVTDRDGNIYEGAAGTRAEGSDEPVTLETTFGLWSTTKAVTATAALQQVEDGALDLDAPAAKYAPAIGDLKVIEGFDDQGEPILREPKAQVTTRQLLTHTGGFAYDFFNETYARLATEHGQPSVATCTKAALTTPLTFDPGERWQYGSNLDWVGQVVEGITGKRLGEAFAERIFAPLGMSETSFAPGPDVTSRQTRTHARGEDGSVPVMEFGLPNPPEVDCGGHGLIGTVGDYMKFIRMWLNDGAGESGQVLSADTVEMAVQNHLGDLPVTALPGVIPALSNDAEFFPGMSKSWSLAFMINNEEAPTGRPAGAQGWAGLANLFYWIDRQNGIGGYWATQILPFGDAVSFTEYLNFETAVYDSLRQGAA